MNSLCMYVMPVHNLHILLIFTCRKRIKLIKINIFLSNMKQPSTVLTVVTYVVLIDRFHCMFKHSESQI